MRRGAEEAARKEAEEAARREAEEAVRRAAEEAAWKETVRRGAEEAARKEAEVAVRREAEEAERREAEEASRSTFGVHRQGLGADVRSMRAHRVQAHISWKSPAGGDAMQECLREYTGKGWGQT